MQRKITVLYPRLIIGMILALAIIIASHPFWSSPNFFRSADGYQHLFRLFAFDQALRQGIVHPRWMPDLAFGYGYENLNFYPPLSVYVTETLHLLGFDFVDALKSGYILIIVIGALGAYRLGVAFSADGNNLSATGFLTAIAFIFTPYFIAIDIYMRGALAEALAMALLPWLVWALRLVLTRRSFAAIVLAAVFSAAIMLAHILTMGLAAPFLVAYVIFEWLRVPKTFRGHAAIRLLITGGLGALLSAVYWLPFVAELRLIQVGQTIPLAVETFQKSFFALDKLIQFSFFYRYEGVVAVGIVTLVLAVIGFMLALFSSREFSNRSTVVFFGIVLWVVMLAMTVLVRDVWMRVPGTSSIGFTWRLNVVTTLAFAVMIGALPSFISSLEFLQRWSQTARWICTGLLTAILITSSMGQLTYNTAYYPTSELTRAHLARYEVYSGAVGMTMWDEYFPTTLQLPVGFNSPILQTNPPPSRSDIALREFHPTDRVLNVRANEAISLTMRTIHFPDWYASVDDVPVPAYPSTPLGLLTVDVPAGEHRVRVFHGGTASRWIGTIFSGASGMILIGLSLAAMRRRETHRVELSTTLASEGLVIFLPTMLALVSRVPSPQPVQIDITPKLKLIGVAVNQAQFESGAWRFSDAPARLQIRVYWHVKQVIGKTSFRWRLIDARGQTRTETELLARYGTGFPATWIPDEIISDEYEIPLTQKFLPGRYALQVALDREFVTVTQIDLAQGAIPALNQASIATPLTAQLGEQIRLLGFTAKSIARPGESFQLETIWQTDANILQDYTAFAHLENIHGEVVAQYENIAGIGMLPTTLWAPGDHIILHHPMPLPHDLKPGLYSLVVGMYNPFGHDRLPVLTEAGPASDDLVGLGTVRVPMNVQSKPTHVTDFSLEQSIRLIGYDFHTGQDTAKLVLYWQAQSNIDADYKVFVHIVDSTQTIAAQADRLPANGMYPTRIWQAGEVVLDEYVFPLGDLPSGQSSVIVGMYAPDTGERLAVHGKSGVELANRQVPLEVIQIK